MSTILTVNTIKAIISYDFENVLVMGNTIAQNQHTFTKTLSNGTGAQGTADLIYSTSFTIAGGGNTTLDLAGSLVDAFGNTITMARVKCMLIELTTDTSAVSVLVGNGANPFINWITPSTGAIRIRNGGCFLLSAQDATAYAVTAATGDILKILNEDGANTATLHTTIIGSSA